MTARIRQWTLRMVVMGAGTAVRGRDGMVGVDEAWVFMGKDKGASRTFEQWVRMARSQRFTPVIISQKVQEFIDADLTGGISRALPSGVGQPGRSQWHGQSGQISGTTPRHRRPQWSDLAAHGSR